MKAIHVHMPFDNEMQQFFDERGGLSWETETINGVDGYLCIYRLVDGDDESYREQIATFRPGVWGWVKSDYALVQSQDKKPGHPQPLRLPDVDGGL